MSLQALSWRLLWRHAWATWLTLVSIALGVALTSSILMVHRQVEDSFLGGAESFDLVVGAKGSPLQLVLCTLFHVDQPTGNIDYAIYEKLAQDDRVAKAIPIGLGDNYQGYRIVGTNLDFFDTVRHDSQGNRRKLFSLQEGRWFEDTYDIVLGASVASQAKLKLGDTIYGTHGLMTVVGSELHDDFPYKVVGILEKTGTAHDRALFTTLESIWEIHEEEEKLHQRILGRTDATSVRNEVTAVLVQLHVPGTRFWMVQEISEQTNAMATIPVNEMLSMYRTLLDPLKILLLVVSTLVVLVSICTVFLSMTLNAQQFRHDVELLRMLGATRREIIVVMLGIGVGLIGAGVIAGALLARLGVYVLSPQFALWYGISLSPLGLDTPEVIALAAIFVAGMLAGLPTLLMTQAKR